VKLRVGFGSCGIAAGGRKVLEKLEAEINNHGKDIELILTGCIGMCFYEPIVDVIDNDNVYTYANVTPAIAEEIFNSHIVAASRLNNTLYRLPTSPIRYWPNRCGSP